MKKTKDVVVGCSQSAELAQRLARKLKLEYAGLETGSFPDQETHVRFTKPLKGKRAILVQSLHNPNDSLIELLLAAYTAKEIGAKKVVLVAPYMCYMREDARFHKGEAISAKVIGKIISRAVDELFTIDPHLHRFHDLREVFSIKSTRLSAVGEISKYIKKNFKSPVVIGPDAESYQWAKTVAKPIGCEAAVLEKKRSGMYGQRKMKVSMPEGINIKGKQAIIVDDIIGSGQTIIETVKNLKKAGANDISCIAVHGIFAGKAYEKIKKAGCRRIITTNSVAHQSNKIDLSEMISKKIKK